ncbi:regulating synaptic membrane exocytosis protein 2-like isoform X3 [Symsagittifera roscoffensis]|uniref:regulating synaptic membrane exocytosis protein 2-like isoform X3 n=1 Tax=Symsagittifera roscoffensis TaxID=84072 RepID=UPI00307B17BE
MISSLFGVAAAKVNSLSESIQQLNPTETLENALKIPQTPVPSNAPPPATTTRTGATPAPVPTAVHQHQPRTVSASVPGASARSASVPPSVRKPLNSHEDGAAQLPPPRTLTPTERLQTDEEKIPLPDLSGLSPEEQKKILAVLERQSDESASEQQALDRAKGELEKLEKDVKVLEEQSRSMGIVDGTVCQICFRIKFEPASASTPAGHRCHSCQLKFCASCGIKTQLHTHKLAWQCKLCRKRADILAKSGKWATPLPAPKESLQGQSQNPDQQQQSQSLESSSNQTGKTSQNQNLQQSNLVSKTSIQQSQNHQSTPTRTNNLPPGQVNFQNQQVNPNHTPSQKSPHANQANGKIDAGIGQTFSQSFPTKSQESSPTLNKQQTSQNQQSNQPQTSAQQQNQSPFSQLAKFLPNVIQPLAQAATGGHSHSNIAAAQNKQHPNQLNIDTKRNQKGLLGNGHLANMPASSDPPPPPPPRSPQVYDRVLPARRSLSGRGVPVKSRAGGGNLAPPRRSAPAPPTGNMTGSGPPRRVQPSNQTHQGHYPDDPHGVVGANYGSTRNDDLPDSGYRSESNRTTSSRDSAEKRRRAEYMSHVNDRERRENQMMRKMDSINSEYSTSYADQENMYRGQYHQQGSMGPYGDHPDIRHTMYPNEPRSNVGPKGRIKTSKKRDHPRYYTSGSGRSFSSSEEDIRSTPDLTSWDGFESESLVSDRGLDLWDDYGTGGYSSANNKSWKGSAVDWTQEPDGSNIGRILLHKGAGRELGLKVRGGQPLDEVLCNSQVSPGDMLGSEVVNVQAYRGVLSAFVVNVRRGSPADTVAGIVPGDEILEWNKIIFRNLTHNQVTQVIVQSKQDPEIDLLICRRPNMQLKLNTIAGRMGGANGDGQSDQRSTLLPYPPRPTTRRGQQHDSGGGGGGVVEGRVGMGENNSSSSSALSYSLPASAFRTTMAYNSNMNSSSVLGSAANQNAQLHPLITSECVSGQIQMSLSYSEKDNQLTVTLNQAIDLISRNDGVGGGTRNPYAKLYLLPDRRDDSLRRTKTSYDTLQPVWNQVFTFYIGRSQLLEKELEVTLWDNSFIDTSANSTDGHHSMSMSMAAAGGAGGPPAVKEFLGEVLLSLDQVTFDGELRWYDLHVHDSSSSHSLPIPSPPPNTTAMRQKSAPGATSDNYSMVANRNRQQNNMWTATQSQMDANAAGPFGFSAPQNTWGADTVNKLISNVKRSMHLPLYPHSEHSSPFKTWKHSDAVSSALTPSSRSLSPAHRRRTQSTSEVFASPFDNIRQHEVLRGAEMASFPRSNFENYEANRKQNLMINTYPDQSKAQPPVNMFSGVLAQPSSFFSGLMQKVSDKTTWDSVGDPMAAAQALLGASKPSDGRGLDTRKGATAPSTPLRSSDMDPVLNYPSGLNQPLYPNQNHNNKQIDYLSLSAADTRYGRKPSNERAGGFYEQGYSAGSRSNRYASGYHSAGESYHYVTERRGSDYGDDPDAALYLTDVESRRRRTTSRSSYDGWNNRYATERSPTYFSDVESNQRRRQRDRHRSGGGVDSQYSSSRYERDAPGRMSQQSGTLNPNNLSTAPDYFLGENGSSLRSHQDTRFGSLGGGSAVAHKYMSNATGGGGGRHSTAPTSSSNAFTAHLNSQLYTSHTNNNQQGEVFRFRRYRGGPASRVKQLSKMPINAHLLNPNQAPHPQSLGAMSDYSNILPPHPALLEPTDRRNRQSAERLWHSDVEGGDISTAEYEDGNYLMASRYNQHQHQRQQPPPRRIRSPSGGRSDLSTPTQNNLQLQQKDESSEHSVTPRADIYSPSTAQQDGVIPRRKNSVQNPPISPSPQEGGPSLRRQISDALSYFDNQELIDNEQDLDYFSQSDVTGMRYNRYDHEDALIQDLKEKHRDSFGSSRFGDDSSFDSPSSRKTTKVSSNYEEQTSYSGEHRRSPKDRHNKSYRLETIKSRSYQEEEQNFEDDDHYRKKNSEPTASRYSEDNDKNARRSHSKRIDNYNNDVSPTEEFPEPNRDTRDIDWRSNDSYNQEYDSKRENESSRRQTSSDTRNNEFTEASRTLSNSREDDEEEEEDDIDLEFRRNAAASMRSEGDNLNNQEDEDEDIDDWLLAQSKRYGVKMEQVVDEAQQMLSASMPMGAEAGFFSDSGGGMGLGGMMGGGPGSKKRRPSIGHKIGALVGLSKKSNSMTQLQDVRNKRISIPRTAEVGFHTHDDMKKYLLSRMDNHSLHSSSGSTGTGAASMDASLFLQTQYATPANEQLNSFVDDLGPGQVVGRQVLGSPCLGEIQLSIGLKRNTSLEVEIVRARNLTVRPMSKVFPAAFVKVYLMEGKKCCGKAKTKIARRTTDPYFQQQLTFPDIPNPTAGGSGRTLQVTVWGDYGRMERKCFMGVAQINMDDLNLSSSIVIGWYKLFTSSSLVEQPKISATHLQSMSQLSNF